MQIGTPGAAYGPSSVMSRPTLGQAIRPLPRGGDVIGAAVARAGGVRPAPFNPNVLHSALQHALRLRSAARPVQGGAFVPPPMPGMQMEAPMTPGVPAFTVDPGALLARARLASLLGSGGGM